MERYLHQQALHDLQKKMVFLAGPRQAGKTTMAKQIAGKLEGVFFNYDIARDRAKILNQELPLDAPLIVLDEIHKYSRWRNYLKGLYDSQKGSLKILVTGSAKLDLLRKGGDSLQGRYHLLRLHPLSLAEIKGHTQKDLADLMTLGGFPEPFLSSSEREAKRWSREYRSRLIRLEVGSLEQVKDLALIEQLSYRLPELVSGPLSINSLREDLQVAHETVAHWLTLLENYYAIFRLPCFGSPKIKALKKEQKHYHFDWTLIEDKGARFENLMACHLLKWCHFMTDTEGDEYELLYFRDRQKREVDFVITRNRKPHQFVEAKYNDREVSLGLRYLHQRFPEVPSFQVCFEDQHDFVTREGIRVIPARSFLKTLV